MMPSELGLRPGKYIVTRTAEDPTEPGQLLDWDEVFVLRRGDVLAVATLRSYVSNILLMLDTDRQMRDVGRGGFLDAIERERLRWLADDVTSLAEEWEGHNHAKLPD